MKRYNKELLIINDESIVIGMRFHSEPFVHFTFHSSIFFILFKIVSRILSKNSRFVIRVFFF